MRADRLTIALGLAILAVGAGCSSDGGGTTAPDPVHQIINDGWSRFESDSYASAASKFREAMDVDDTATDAYNGLGWALAFLDSFTVADEAFGNAIQKGHSGADAYAGRALVRAEPPISDLESAIDDAGMAIERDGGFVFAHDSSVDWRDLRLLRAQAYFQIDRTDSAAAEVAELGGQVPLAGPDFDDELLAEIERLGDDFGAYTRASISR